MAIDFVYLWFLATLGFNRTDLWLWVFSLSQITQREHYTSQGIFVHAHSIFGKQARHISVTLN